MLKFLFLSVQSKYFLKYVSETQTLWVYRGWFTNDPIGRKSYRSQRQQLRCSTSVMLSNVLVSLCHSGHLSWKIKAKPENTQCRTEKTSEISSNNIAGMENSCRKRFTEENKEDWFRGQGFTDYFRKKITVKMMMKCYKVTKGWEKVTRHKNLKFFMPERNSRSP